MNIIKSSKEENKVKKSGSSKLSENEDIEEEESEDSDWRGNSEKNKNRKLAKTKIGKVLGKSKKISKKVQENDWEDFEGRYMKNGD
jgi:hypothetical protein